MPGLVGLVTAMPAERAEAQLRAMVAAIAHERFYRTGTWSDPAAGVYVGWAVREGSFADGLPWTSERGDITLAFSGEDYPEPDVRGRLELAGHTVAAGASAYLVHLAEEDRDFPAGLNGRFHGLLVDRGRQRVTLFNDRYGMRRVCYHEAKDAFYFAAEAKAILAVRPELRRIDPRGLGEFVACGSVLENRTLFRDVHVLPPASAWVFRAKALDRRQRYFHPREWEEQEPLEPEAYYRELRGVFSRVLPRYFAGPERIGMSLTGGLDTRAVMAWQRCAPGALRCYTYGGMYRECRDVAVARRVAEVCRQPHDVIPVGGTFLARFPHYAERSVYLADGCTDLLRSPDLYVSEQARTAAPIRMTGLYGDEVLRHQPAFKPKPPVPGLFTPDITSEIEWARATYAAALDTHRLSFAVFRQAGWHHHGILALEETQVGARTPFLDNALVRLVFRSPRAAAATNDLRVRLIADGNPALAALPTDLGFGGDRRSMSAPLARAVLRLTFRAEYAYDHGMPQWLARVDRRLARLRLERRFLGRHKLFHFRVWYRDALAEYVRQMLLDSRTLARPYLDRAGVERIVSGHLGGRANFTTEIHKLLSLELVHRLFVDA